MGVREILVDIKRVLLNIEGKQYGGLMKSIAVIFFALFATGCTMMTEKQCQTADWSKLGFQDAKNGETFEMFRKREKLCTKHKVRASRADYAEGYREGVKAFCTFENGLEHGEGGAVNNQICPEELAKEFNKGYTAGLRVYQVKKQLEKQEEEHNAEIKRQLVAMEDKQKDRDEDALKKMSQCSFDSDCAPLKCSSEHVTVGTASGFVNKCVNR